MQTEKKRVTFTDFVGTLITYPVWLFPTLIAVAYTYPNLDSFKLSLFAMLVFLGQNIQHHFHRFMGKSTFKALNHEEEKKLVTVLTILSFPFLITIWLFDPLSSLLSIICLLICFAYTIIEPFKEYLLCSLGFLFEFVTAYRFLTLQFPEVGITLLHTGICVMVGSWLVGYRVMTGDYGKVPLPQKNVFQHLLAITVATALLALGVLWF